MSNLELRPVETPCGGAVTGAQPVLELLEGRDVPLGRYTVVRRFLPHKQVRTVGAWCFLDYFGPDDVSTGPGMQVPPHPHTGLQTVSLLFEGEVFHRDSLGNAQTVRPGELNLMTAAHGIAHSEESPAAHSSLLHGVQIWIALPEGARHRPAAFEHLDTLPVVGDAGARVTVFVGGLAGGLAGTRSPASVHTPLVGADIALAAGADTLLPLEPDFEHAVAVLSGAVEVAGAAVPANTMVYLGTGRTTLGLKASPASRVLLLGGVPFDEHLVMWWNFVARSHDEIVEQREDWLAGRRFGVVRGYAGEPLPAPPMPTTRLKPRGRQGH